MQRLVDFAAARSRRAGWATHSDGRSDEAEDKDVLVQSDDDEEEDEDGDEDNSLSGWASLSPYIFFRALTNQLGGEVGYL